MRRLLCIIFYICYVECKLWPRGVVHYAINKKDYDPHSRDIIASTFEQLEREVCVKFFNTPLNFNATNDDKILYISNPDKRKDCPPVDYNYDKNIVDMQIGYKCLNEHDIARIVLDMLRASVVKTEKPNSNDLLRRFQEVKQSNAETLLSAADRNFINGHYLEECENLVKKPVDTRRSTTWTMEVSANNEKYYEDKIWPFGIVMYGCDPNILSLPEYSKLSYAMMVIELASCVVFKSFAVKDPLQPKNLLWFGLQGEEMPHLGFMEGNQTLSISHMAYGAPGHSAHTLNALMRVLGIPMMSNRYDRDNYVTINWKNVAMMSEHYLERVSEDAWLRNTEGEGAPYDYDSVTHAPANFMCADCSLGEQTVTPVQDHLWQRTLSMGHHTELSAVDKETIALLYNKECQKRIASDYKK
ncbi:unnamed protein product [Spodoptera littoralis]|uniref:Peptidase M12A domain-containing protein n=1 Tax=Spodoptera littoralis TaxID=7109 RepID=A0A9P0I735_SPOLI|nr:unnamed protein product [Spodoptera littoralis]CAH1642697.1 unnamed protein product [Spodoptera littoralis]